MHKIKTFPSTIKGSVKISGSKNASLPIIAASLINDGVTKLLNIPNISDVNNLQKVLVKTGFSSKKKLNYFCGKRPYKSLLFNELQTFRASYYLMGAFLAKYQEVEIYAPGGCQIGSRPIDFHIAGFKLAGVEVLRNDHIIHLKAKKLQPFVYKMPKKSLGATVNLMILASKIPGVSVIGNASTEPEVDDLLCFLNKLGVIITRYNGSIIVCGKTQIEKKITYRIMPDRIEALTFICLGCFSQKLVIKKINPNNILKPLTILMEAGLKVKKYRNSITIYQSKLKPVEVFSGDYPELSTDAMPLLYPLFIRCEGVSYFHEGIFNNRFNGALELRKTNALIEVKNQSIIIKGHSNLCGAEFFASDLRAAALLLIEAIINGNSVVNNLEYLERGYADIYDKLRRIKVKYEIS